MQLAQIISVLSGVVVVSSGLFLVGLCVIIVVKPPLAERFFGSFASSARAHFTEMGLRVLAGVSMVNFADRMWFPLVFWAFGWILIITAAGLLLVPWRWHNRFAEWAVPLALRRMWLLVIGSATLGLLILGGMSRVVFY